MPKERIELSRLMMKRAFHPSEAITETWADAARSKLKRVMNVLYRSNSLLTAGRQKLVGLAR